MKRIDKLYMKALKIKPKYDDICIISNATGRWKIEEKEYTSLEAAERDAYSTKRTAADNMVAGGCASWKTRHCSAYEIPGQHSIEKRR